MRIKLFLLGCLVAISTSSWATDEGEFRGETKAKIEILQKQNDELKTTIDEIEKNNISIEVLKNSIFDQDKRIQDLSLYVSITATIIAILTLIAGVGGVAFPYVMYKQNTKAQENAKKDIEAWKEKTKLEFDKELNSFKDHAQGAKSEITTSVEEAKKVEFEIKNIQNGLQNGQLIPQNEPNNDSSLSRVAIKVREKPQSEYTFEDWNKLAFDAYKKDKKEDALFYWRKAIEISEPISKQKSQILFNIAVTLGQLKRTEEELSVYDKIIQEFQGIEEGIHEVIRAKAQVNKATILVQVEQNEKAMNIYDELIDTLSGTQNEALQEQRARALVNKGATLGKLNRLEEALLIFEKVINELEDSQAKGLQIQRAKALVNKGVALGHLNRAEDSLIVFNKIINELKTTQDKELQEQRAQAYINSLEMQLIIGKNSENKIDENIRQYLNDNKQEKLQFSMLMTLKEALESDQAIRFKELKNEFKYIDFGEWRWKELDDWANSLEDTDVRERVIATIEQFKNWDMDSRSSRE